MNKEQYIQRRRDYLDLGPHPLHIDKPRNMRLRLAFCFLYLLVFVAAALLGFLHGSR